MCTGDQRTIPQGMKNRIAMKKPMLIAAAIAVISSVSIFLVSFSPASTDGTTKQCHVPQQQLEGCVFKTIYEGEGVDTAFTLVTPPKVLQAENRALDWLVKAQA